MKREIFASLAACVFAGCATHDPDLSAMHRNYGAADEPQVNVTAEGTPMRGLIDPRAIPTGQFTGQQRTRAQIGQYRTPPPAAGSLAEAEDAKPPQVGSGIVPPRKGAGAGDLGQAGLYPGEPVNPGAIMSSPPAPMLGASARPPDPATTPTLAEPLTRGVGAPAGTEFGAASETLPPLRVDPPATFDVSPNRTGSMHTAVDDIGSTVRDVLATGRPGTITALTPNRLENIVIEGRAGNITLRGDVRSHVEKLMIGRKVRDIQGVESVNNQLRVVSPTRRGLPDITSPEERADPLFPEK